MKFVSTVLLATALLFPKLGICQNTNVQEMPFKIAGGKTIQVKISDQGAASAEKEKIKITEARTTLFFLDAKTNKVIKCPDFLMKLIEENWKDDEELV